MCYDTHNVIRNYIPIEIIRIKNRKKMIEIDIFPLEKIRIRNRKKRGPLPADLSRRK